jgi:nucleotide-binding universal stress UspA family protein
MKILLPVDGSACSEAAVAEVARRPWPEGSQLRILTVVELPFVPTPETWALPESYYSRVEQGAREQAREIVDKAVAQLRQATGLEVSTAILDGYAKDTILAEAEQWGADLIVVGSHGYRGWQRFLLGSVSQAVASHAQCSVEIVRCRQAATRLSAAEE